MSEAVPIYPPLDDGKVRRMFRGTRAIKGSLTPVYENDTGPEDDGFSSCYVLRNDQRQDEIRIETGDRERDRLLAEYVVAAVNNHDEIMLALAAEHMVNPQVLRQPWPDSLDKLILHVATAPGPDRRLDDRIHDAFQIDATFARNYSASFDAVHGLVMTALPTWGFKLSYGPAPMTNLVATMMRPAKNPEGSVTDGDSWGKHYDARGANNALALMHAFLLAIRDNPLEG